MERVGLIIAYCGLTIFSIELIVWHCQTGIERGESFPFLGDVESDDLRRHPIAMAVMGVSTLVYAIGLSLIARSKGRSVAWAVCALFYILGIVFVLVLEPLPRRQTDGQVKT